MSIKDVRSQGGEEVVQCGERGFFRCTIWCKKTLGFFTIYGVSALIKGEGVNFSRFCADVFYGRSLTKNLGRIWAKFHTAGSISQFFDRIVRSARTKIILVLKLQANAFFYQLL